MNYPLSNHVEESEAEQLERRRAQKRSLDYTSGIIRARSTSPLAQVLQPDPNYIVNLLNPQSYKDNSSAALVLKFVHSSYNKLKHSINCVAWTPEGRRVLTGSGSGEFTLWNGQTFNFEQLTQAHDNAIWALRWSPNGEWLLSADDDGLIKYWQPTMHNLKVIEGHSDPIRDLAFSPNSGKFVSASDDGKLKIWDFNEGIQESILEEHGWDVRCTDWHPTKGLIVSGSKDHMVKFWDPRTGKSLATLRGHKNTVMSARFQPTNDGNLLATGCRDQTARIFDLRAMKDFKILRGGEKDVTSLAWHPVNRALITTGMGDGRLNHYLLDEQPPQATLSTEGTAEIIQPSDSIAFAHSGSIWAMDYHPMGHLLCTGSSDRMTNFWARPRPGDASYKRDKYFIGEEAAERETLTSRAIAYRRLKEAADEASEQGGLVDQQMPLANQKQIPFPPVPLPPMDPEVFRNAMLGNAKNPRAPIPFPFPPPPLPNQLPPGIDMAALLASAKGGARPPLPPPPMNGIAIPGLPQSLPPGFSLPPPPPSQSLDQLQRQAIPGLASSSPSTGSQNR